MKPKKGPGSQGQREVRVYAAPQKFEVRKNADGSRSIAGYAATFGDLSEDLGGWREKIQPGAFAQSLKDNPDVLCLFGHDSNQILGRVSSSTLTISEDGRGLLFSCVLPDTSTARDLISLLERGDIRSMSFGFSTVRDDWQEVNGQIVRTLIEVQLWEVSVVGQPAYKSSSVDLRSCPAALRSKLTRNDDDDLDEDGEGPDGCGCACEACVEGECSNCSADGCDEQDCLENGCPMQDEARSDGLRIRRLIAQRRAANKI